MKPENRNSSPESKSYDELLSRIQQATSESELRELEKLLESESRWVVGSLGEVAAFFGCQLQTVKEWRVGPNRMPGDEGRWDLQEITLWRCDRLKATTGNTKTARQKELDEKQQEIRLQRDITKLRNEQGELISRVAAAAKVAEMLNEARVQIESIPSICGASVPPEMRADLVHEWEQQISLVLKKLAGRAKEEF